MSGYNIEATKDNIVSWGHITCGGTVANIEAMWAARNLKFHPLAVKKALAVSLFLKANIFYKLYLLVILSVTSYFKSFLCGLSFFKTSLFSIGFTFFLIALCKLFLLMKCNIIDFRMSQN